jgi:hypothetical protein
MYATFSLVNDLSPWWQIYLPSGSPLSAKVQIHTPSSCLLVVQVLLFGASRVMLLQSKLSEAFAIFKISISILQHVATNRIT